MIRPIIRVGYPSGVAVCPRKNIVVQPKRNAIVPKIAWNDPAIPYFVGKSVILFTFFYTSLQWMHYKRLREIAEK